MSRCFDRDVTEQVVADADTSGLPESPVDARLPQSGDLERYFYQEPLRTFASGHAFTGDGPAALTRLVRFYSAEGRPLRAGA
jgi:hypothetical protein